DHRPLGPPQPQLAPNRLFSSEKSMRESLAHDDHGWRMAIVAIGEIPALGEPDPHEVEVSRPHLGPVDAHALATAGQIPIDLHRLRIVVVAVEAEWRVPETHGPNSMQGLDAIAHVPHKELAL